MSKLLNFKLVSAEHQSNIDNIFVTWLVFHPLKSKLVSASQFKNIFLMSVTLLVSKLLNVMLFNAVMLLNKLPQSLGA